ncbi:MAG: glutamyl-tRNA reductase [candidate division Zixibacteria bacterium]|nr:glutamyl-tRNA reductase [candidate division Zixibacteria bacterium]MBU1470133.1 glutamyl-tRNA reductase [candidate division Zixibacteria bacterium]MBU2626025.1 glutamyl-tRNA reductase [candidate division Zixibacteria bacterium]
MSELGIIGTSIWQQNMPLLECLTVNRDDTRDVLPRLKAALDLEELVYIATCNRVEFIYLTSGEGEWRGANLLHRLIDFFFVGSRKTSFFPNDFYHYTGREAVTHIFRTTSSLDSLVIGETQIAGQVKTAHQEAAESGLCGPALEKLISEALNVARKVKRETSIGEGALSMASLATYELQEALGSEENPLIALIGSDAMRTKIAKYINGSLGGNLVFVNRTIERAKILAEQFGGTAMTLDDFRENPGPVQAVVSSTAATEPVFDSAFLDKLNHLGSPVVCIDLAVPRDFSIDFNDSGLVKLIDIPMLKSKGKGSLRNKFVEASKANEIVRSSVNQFLSSQIETSIKPIFYNSYKEALQLAEKALDDLFDKRAKALGREERMAVTRLVTKLIGHSSFQPAKMLSNFLVEVQSDLSFGELFPQPRKAKHKKAV